MSVIEQIHNRQARKRFSFCLLPTKGSTYGRSLDDGSSLDNFLLVHLGTGTVKVTDDGGHTGLVAHGGRQVDGLLGVILGEAAEQFSICPSNSDFCVSSSRAKN